MVADRTDSLLEILVYYMLDLRESDFPVHMDSLLEILVYYMLDLRESDFPVHMDSLLESLVRCKVDLREWHFPVHWIHSTLMDLLSVDFVPVAVPGKIVSKHR